MFIQLKRKEASAKYPSFPWADDLNEKYFFPKSHAKYILRIPPQSSDKKYMTAMAAAAAQLFHDLGITSLVFLGDGINAWRCQKNEHPPVKAALRFLKYNKISKRFNGALVMSQTHWPAFFLHLFWLQRCNAALPGIYFLDDEQRFLGHFCRYENIHFDLLKEGLEDVFKSALSGNSLTIAKDNKCVPLYWHGNGIKGRQTVV